eukprot:CAMPEP_0182424506 /NCGR_PEP_ID=MMETSP1167-20130531/10717_1 /TAXON_ID=2988 /ORGANISM="Mallomonas Sp, Strain CCMP3275" /LENGTH=233 /DNA_ID=CAMNT_0024604367 /DNA_START=85 /DNA_END=786 /DNA_ORIENTATION=-
MEADSPDTSSREQTLIQRRDATQMTQRRSEFDSDEQILLTAPPPQPPPSVRHTSSPPVTGAADNIRGTLGFASSRVLRGSVATYRDDLESLAFSLAYLLNGKLPWSNIDLGLEDENEADREKKGAQEKIAITAQQRIDNMLEYLAGVQDTCTGEDLCLETSVIACPAANLINDMLLHARSLEPSSKPDYVMLKAKAMNALTSLGKVSDGLRFDWEIEGISWSPIDGSIVNKNY